MRLLIATLLSGVMFAFPEPRTMPPVFGFLPLVGPFFCGRARPRSCAAIGGSGADELDASPALGRVARTVSPEEGPGSPADGPASGKSGPPRVAAAVGSGSGGAVLGGEARETCVSNSTAIHRCILGRGSVSRFRFFASFLSTNSSRTLPSVSVPGLPISRMVPSSRAVRGCSLSNFDELAVHVELRPRRVCIRIVTGGSGGRIGGGGGGGASR